MACTDVGIGAATGAAGGGEEAGAALAVGISSGRNWFRPERSCSCCEGLHNGFESCFKLIAWKRQRIPSCETNVRRGAGGNTLLSSEI